MRRRQGGVLGMVLLAVGSLAAVPVPPGDEPRVDIELKAAAPAAADVYGLKLTAAIVNRGKAPVTLVLPGDGSDYGWRTPVLKWRVDGQVIKGGPRCGNINALRPGEVFVLRPGERKELGAWIGAPALLGAGKHRLTLEYANVPGLKWSGVPLGKHDAETMKRVQSSTAVRALSNAVMVEVRAK